MLPFRCNQPHKEPSYRLLSLQTRHFELSEAKHRRGGVSSEPNFRLVRRNRQHEQKVFVFIDNRVLCTYKSLKVLSIETATMRTNCTPTPVLMTRAIGLRSCMIGNGHVQFCSGRRWSNLPPDRNR